MMYVKLAEKWLQTLHITGPIYRNREMETYIMAFAKWLDKYFQEKEEK